MLVGKNCGKGEIVGRGVEGMGESAERGVGRSPIFGLGVLW